MKTVMDWMSEAMQRNREARGDPQFPQRGPTRPAEPELPFPPDITPPADFAEALRGMANKPFLKSQKYQEQQMRANRDGAHPKILAFEKTFIKRMAKLNVPVFAHCVVRTEVEQLREFLDGTSKDHPGDGIWPHNGTAVDIVHSNKAWALSDLDWKLFHHVGKEVAAQCGLIRRIEWGGSWSFYDPAHWQLKDWQEQQQQHKETGLWT